MPPDIWSLYGSMLKSRLIEEAIAALWHEGSISGEMHLGTGEEAVIAGVVAQIGEGDAMALDHRGTAALVMRGVDPRLILRELLGRPDGLCGGQGGHMHLFSKRHLAASSGIVGSSGPAVAGFALAADYLRPGSVAVGFFGEGAMNQGMLMDALVNHAAKVEAFSGGRWTTPLVVRAPCGGGYGDGGQHEQALWGWLGHIPGLTVVVPSTPADAGGLLTAALEHDGPVLFLEPKLLSESWLEFLGSGGRATVEYDVPADGANGVVPDRWEALPLGKATVRREGSDLTMVSVGVGVHRSLEAARALESDGVSAGVLDLRTVSPLDKATVREAVSRTGHLLAVDEDYEALGLSGELAATVLEADIRCRFARVCTRTTIPYAPHLERETIPNTDRITAAARKLLGLSAG